MAEQKKRDGGLTEYIEDCLMEAPRSYSLEDGNGGSRLFRLWPATLGKMFLAGRELRRMHADVKAMAKFPSVVCLRLCREHRAEAVRVLALYNCRTMEEHFDAERLDADCAYISRNIEEPDLAALLLSVLSADRYAEVEKSYGLDTDALNRQRVARAKASGGSSVSFGGRSLYGTIISHFVGKGMSVRHIVWEESYINLRLLMADEPCSVYLSKDERKRVHLKGRPDEVIRADDPKNMQRVAEIINGGLQPCQR